jgi:hypothetical protein
MKPSKKVLISSVLILALLMGAVVVIEVFGPPKPLAANVIFDPNTIDLGDPVWAVKEVVVTLWFKGKYDGRDVDPKTVLIDGVLEPKGGWKKTWVERVHIKELHLNAWVFRFKVSGSSLRDLLWTKVGHMDPGLVHVPLEVTGTLYDGTAFTGTGYIDTYNPGETPPPPP